MVAERGGRVEGVDQGDIRRRPAGRRDPQHPPADDPDVAPRRLVREPGGPGRFAHLARRPHARNGDRQPVEVEVHGPLCDLPAAVASYGELRPQPAVDPRCLDWQRAELWQSPVGERADRATDDRDVAVGARGDVVDPQLREPVREVGREEVVDAVAAQRVEQICHGRRAGLDLDLACAIGLPVAQEVLCAARFTLTA